MKNRSNRGAVVALLAVFACGLIGAGAGLHRAKSSHLQALRKTLAEKQGEVEEVRAKVKEMPELEARYAALHRQVAVLEPALPTEAYIPTFLSQLQTLAAQTYNRLTLIKPKPKRKLPASSPAPEEEVTETGKSAPPAAAPQAETEEAKSPYDEIEIELGLEGTYWSALAFLERLRAFPKMIAVNEISMKPKPAVAAALSGEPPLEIGLQLTAVMARDSAVAAPAR